MFSDVTIYSYNNHYVNDKVYKGPELNFLPVKGMLLKFNFGTVHVKNVEFDITLNKLYLKVTPDISLSDEYDAN